MLPSKKPQNPSKFNSLAQIQIKCVKLAKTLPSSKSNRSNSSLNLTSPPQSKDKPEDLSSQKQKPQMIIPQNTTTTPKNYFLMPAHSGNNALNRSKTLHHYKMNLVNSHNDQLNDSNKENYGYKGSSPLQNSMGVLSKTTKEDSISMKNSMKGTSLSQRTKNVNNWQNSGIRESEEDKKPEFLCSRHPMKKAKYFIQEKIKGKNQEEIVFCCSKCAIELASQGKKIFEVHEEVKESPESSENFSRIPEETSKNTIIDELNENVLEIDTSEINKRDIDLSKFIRKLQDLKQECGVAFEQLNSRKKDIIFFYDKQIIKLDQIYNNLLRVIEKEKNQSTGKLKQFMGSTTAAFNSMISQMEGNIKDMNFIYNDIEQNKPNILKHMETDPFNLILSKYEEKLKHYQEYWQGLYVEKLVLEKMTNSSIKIYQKKIEEVLTPHLASLFSTFEVTTSYLKKDVSIESESPIPLEKNLPKYNVFGNAMNKANNENNSIYISFENKDMFENAIRNSLANGLKNNNTMSNNTFGNVNGNRTNQLPISNNINVMDLYGNKAVPIINSDLNPAFSMNHDNNNNPFIDNSTFSNNSNNIVGYPGKNTYSLNHDTSISKLSSRVAANFDPSLNKTTNLETSLNKSPKVDTTINKCASQDFIVQKISNQDMMTSHVANPHNNNTSLENDYITTPKSIEKGIREFNSAQPGKLLNNLNKDLSSSSKSKNKRFQSTDKLQNKKYLTLLEKVNHTQNNTNVFYSNVIQTKAPMTSPPSEKQEIKGIFQSLDHRANFFEFPKNKVGSLKTGNVLQPSPFKNSQNKEIKNYEGFFNFIENKLQDDCEEKEKHGGTGCVGFQKTLFCSSPHFKDV